MKSKKARADYYFSDGAEDRFYSKLYPGQLKNEKFLALSLGAKYLYLASRAHVKTSECRRTLHAHSQAFGREYPESAFCFTAQQLARYGISRSKAPAWFRELVQNGFLSVMENNALQRLPNVYCFSASWRDENKSRAP